MWVKDEDEKRVPVTVTRPPPRKSALSALHSSLLTSHTYTYHTYRLASTVSAATERARVRREHLRVQEFIYFSGGRRCRTPQKSGNCGLLTEFHVYTEGGGGGECSPGPQCLQLPPQIQPQSVSARCHGESVNHLRGILILWPSN